MMRATAMCDELGHPPASLTYSKLVQEFTSFWQCSELDGFVSMSDPRLSRVFEPLPSLLAARLDSPTTSIDAWARYFLLMSRQRRDLKSASDNQQTPEIGFANLHTNELATLLHDYVQHRPDYNLIMQEIYDGLWQCRHDEQIQRFVKAPDYAEKFLAAHLNKSAKYEAQIFFSQRLGSLVQTSQNRHLFSVADCFQIASVITADAVAYLADFKFEKRNQIKTFVQAKLKVQIPDEIRKFDRSARIQKRSTYGLLKDLTTWGKVVERSLYSCLPKQKSVKQKTLVVHYQLILQAFQEIYPGKKTRQGKFPPPSDSEMKKICDRYPKLRDRYLKNHQSKSPDLSAEDVQTLLSLEVTSQNLEQTLKGIAEAVKRDYTIAIDTRINDSAKSEDDPSPRLQDLEDSKPELWEQVWMEAHVAEARNTITRIFSELERNHQVLLLLYLGMNFSQFDIISVFGQAIGVTARKQQYKLCRLIQDLQKKQLKKFIKNWQCQYSECTSEQDINTLVRLLGSLFKDCLEEHCRSQVLQQLNHWFQEQSQPDQVLLDQRYRQQLAPDAIATQSQQTPQVVCSQSAHLIQTAADDLKAWLETFVGHPFQDCEVLSQNLTRFVQTTLSETVLGDEMV